MKLKVYIANAFPEKNFGGNPAGIFSFNLKFGDLKI
jgi:predicted PhzF superfamily epimerase YddE/YHI9